MLTDKAIIDYVDRLIYKPGWTFEAFSSDLRPGAVTVIISHKVPDTSYPPKYVLDLPEPFKTYAHIDVDKVNSLKDVGRIILEAIINHERDMLVHEAREYFRVNEGDGTYPAPFHPHHAFQKPGRVNWKLTMRYQHPENSTLPDL